MSTIENKKIVRQYFDHWGSAEYEREALAPDFVGHMPGAPGPLDREAFIQSQADVLAAFPDFAPTLEDQIADGDLVTSRLVFRGTHNGTFQGIPATGRPVTVKTITIERVVDGKIVEHWIEFDALGMLQQMGVAPVE